MDATVEFLQHHATLVLFICISAGYLIGGVRIGRFRLGGVCGTLLMSLLLGQADVVVAPGASQVAFALFVFSLGYLAGPQFVASFRREDIRLVIFPVIELVVVTALVLVATVALGLGPGVAAGLFAGATSQSAALGTAAEALNHVGLFPTDVAAQQTDLASAYSLCYLVGLVTIVVFGTQIAPALMRIDLRTDAAAVLKGLGDGCEVDPPAHPDLAGRVYLAGANVPTSVTALEGRLGHGVLVSAVVRDGEVVRRQPTLSLVPTDLVHIIGRREALVEVASMLGEEVAAPRAIEDAASTVEVMITRRALAGSAGRLQQLLEGHGDVALIAVQRAGRAVLVDDDIRFRPGDVLTVLGSADALARAGTEFGHAVDRTIRADWAYLGAGVVVGMLTGIIDLQWGPLDMTIGTGGGVLLAGLLFGWFRMSRSTIGAYVPAAAEVIKDLGLTIFIAVAGLTGAPRLGSMFQEFGLRLPLAAIVVSLVPAVISLIVARRALRLPSPLALGAVVGQQCSTPALTLLEQRAGNSTPLLTFVKVYAMCNVVLPLLAPFIVAIAAAISR